MIEVVGFCVLCFAIVEFFFFWLIRSKWVWIILMGCVRVLVSLCSHGGPCDSLSAFWIELRRADFCQGLQREEAGEGCCLAVGQGSAISEVIKHLALYSGSSQLFRLCWNNKCELRAPLCELRAPLCPP